MLYFTEKIQKARKEEEDEDDDYCLDILLGKRTIDLSFLYAYKSF